MAAVNQATCQQLLRKSDISKERPEVLSCEAVVVGPSGLCSEAPASISIVCISCKEGGIAGSARRVYGASKTFGFNQ